MWDNFFLIALKYRVHHTAQCTTYHISLFTLQSVLYDLCFMVMCKKYQPYFKQKLFYPDFPNPSVVTCWLEKYPVHCSIL